MGAGCRGRGLQRAPRAGAGRVGGASRCSRASGAAVVAAAKTTRARLGLHAEGRHGHDCGAAAGGSGGAGGWPWFGERRVRVAGPGLRRRGARRAKRARAGGGPGLWTRAVAPPGGRGLARLVGVARWSEVAWVYGPAQVPSGTGCGTRPGGVAREMVGTGSPRSVRRARPSSYKLPKSSATVPCFDSQISFIAVASQRLKRTQVISLKAGFNQQSAKKTRSPLLPLPARLLVRFLFFRKQISFPNYLSSLCRF